MKISMPLSQALAAVALLSACAGPNQAVSEQRPPAASAAERRAALAAVDWRKAEKITIELRDYGFHPRELVLRRGKPYRLRVFNSGGNTHYLDAPEFFAAIAARKVEVPDMAEIKAEQFAQFEIFRRGGELAFEFVPLVPGRYRAHCHLEGHAKHGVEGWLVVE